MLIRLVSTTVLLLLLTSNILVSQIPKGQWRDHLPYNTAHSVAVSKDKVYCAAEHVMFYYDLEDNSVNRMSKTSGLSDLGIGYVAYNSDYDCLVVGYSNGNIDVFKKGKKYNIPDIKEKNLLVDKQINHISFEQDKAYLSCGFGIVVLNIDKLEISDTYLLGAGDEYVKVQASIIFGDEIFALTQSGILKGDIKDQFLSFHEQWIQDTLVNHRNTDFYSTTIFNDKLYMVSKYDANITDSTTETKYILQAFNGSSWKVEIDTLPIIKSISSNNDELIIMEQWHANVYNHNYELVGHYGAPDGKSAVKGDNGYIYVADETEGLLICHPEKGITKVSPSGPYSDKVFSMSSNGDEILVAPGGHTGEGTSLFISGDIYNFKDNVWGVYHRHNSPLLANVRDIISFAVQKGNSNKYYAVSWGYGLVEVENNEVTNVYTPENTDNVLKKFLGGSTFDNEGNLWVVCSKSDNNFVVKTPDGSWYNHSYGGHWGNLLSGKTICTSHGELWTISKRGEGFFVWNHNGTPEDESDDTYKKFRLIDEEASLISSILNDIVEDIEGTIWIGTSDGVAIIDNPREALNGDPLYARTPELVIDGYLKPLLKGENVTAIAVDGANRKWIGTAGGGLFLVSADGTKQILVYNETNSALLSDNILALEINQETGELFVGTDKGIIAFMTTSSGGNKSYSNVYAFPNPVKDNYDGLITIRGLMYESNVKITDLSGHLVYETTSNGGDAIWNGRDLKGNKVSSGVYMVFATNADGSEAEVTKILMVR